MVIKLKIINIVKDKEGIPELIIKRAEYLYQSIYAKEKELLSAKKFPNEKKSSTYMDVNDLNGAHLPSKSFLSGANQIEVLCEEVESAITVTFVGCRFLKRLCDVQTR